MILSGNHNFTTSWASYAYQRISNKQNSDIPEIVGDCEWFTNAIVSFFSDGTLSWSGGSGKWKKNEEGATYDYIINWDNGYVDKLNLTGLTLKGVNQNGTSVSGKRSTL